MDKNHQIRLDHISTHLENACKEILFSDEPLTTRVQVATVDLETLHPDDFNDVPSWLKSDIERMASLVGDQVSQDDAVSFASNLLNTYVKTEVLRTQNGVKN